jgi:hypothetical protein
MRAADAGLKVCSDDVVKMRTKADHWLEAPGW